MSTTAELTFHSLAEEFLRRFRQDACTVEQFAEEFPQYSKLILAEFPALIVAEQLKKSLFLGPQPISPPAVICGYRVGKKIGAGGMGFVYSAVEEATNQEVALKLLPLEKLRSTSSLQRFLIEAKTGQALDHPSIAPVYAYGTEGDYAYLAMRYVKGICLDKLVEKLADKQGKSDAPVNVLDWNVIATLGEQITGALQHAHERGVVHRDIKPSNLNIDHDGVICILDFGVAKVEANDQRLSRTGDIIGTPRYMAPEQIRGASDARCDIYSLGITLYELATGSLVWRSLSFKQLVTQRASLELPHVKELNPTIPDPLANIIMKACALHPEHRFQTAAEMGQALSQFLTTEPTSTAAFHPTRPAGNSPFRRTALLWSGILGISAVVAAKFLLFPLSNLHR